MKYRGHYILFMLSLAFWLMGCIADPAGKVMPSLRETFSKNDKQPFGAYVAYHELENIFNRNTIRNMRKSFDKTWNSISDTASLYVCITRVLYLDEAEANAMLGFVEKGNTVFISASRIDERLLEQLKMSQHSNFLIPQYSFNDMKQVSTNYKSNSYNYFYLPFTNSFGIPAHAPIRTIGTNEFGNANCVVYFYGRGKLFLHSEPRALSNYFLLKQSNYLYWQQLLSVTQSSPEHVYWDDYYHSLTSRSDSNNNFSSFSEIMKNPPLAKAFWLLLILLALYILYGVKRKQRSIAVVKPNENSTVAFTETIGRLYLQKKDNKNIAEKMITYFNEYIRNTYFLNTNQINTEFIQTLSRKSAVPFNKVESLYRAIHHAQETEAIDDYQLMSLHELMLEFNKKIN